MGVVAVSDAACGAELAVDGESVCAACGGSGPVHGDHAADS